MMMREKKLFARKARLLLLSKTRIISALICTDATLSFRLDNFDYDEISLGSEESSPHVEMALLSHTLQYLTGRINYIQILHNFKIQHAMNRG